MRVLVGASGDILAVLRLDGTIEIENAAVQRVLGYKLEERIGKRVFDFVHPNDIPAALDALQKAAQDVGSMQRVEVRARHRNGSWIWLEAVGSMIRRGSDLVAVVVSREVSARKRLESGIPRESAYPTVQLTEVELRVLRLVAMGLSNQEIARTLGLSPHTVKEYVAKASRKRLYGSDPGQRELLVLSVS